MTYLYRLIIIVETLLSTNVIYGQTSTWSAKALWISPCYTEDSVMRPCPIFRKQFLISKNITSAKAYITALGLYEGTLNGKRIGKGYFTPGWTSYDYRLQYQVYDVKELIQRGKNEISVIVAEGWYRGTYGHFMARNNYGREAGLLVQLEITYVDGAKDLIVTDSSWYSSTGPILHSDIYNGELYDARIEPKDWSAVNVIPAPPAALVPTVGEPVEQHEPIHPVGVFQTPKGEQVIDFGQNMSGWVRFRVRGNPGDTIKISHAEVLDKAGNFYTGNLREAKAIDIYVLNGNNEEVFEPHFAWHGFRYARVEGCTADTVSFRAIPLYTAMKPAGTFSCSSPLINQLHQNIQWSLRSNFFDIPMDCPQRSERLGWTGDAQVFCRTASFHYDVKNFYNKWLLDLKVDQRGDGSVPNIVPNLYRKLGKRSGVAGWGDAAAIVPWTLYWVYGDTAMLREPYSSMKAWVDYITSVSRDDLWTAGGYGDWLAPGDSTSLPYIDQCFWAHSTQILINSAKVLGYTDDTDKYAALLRRIKSAFLAHYVDGEGKAISNTQTAYVLALEFDMLPDSLRPKATKRLAELIRSNNNHLSTGFLGAPYLLHALSNNGYTDIAYDLLNQDTYPSWLYPVKMGATTIWEKWDAIKPDSTVQATSYNHYSYGAVGDWLYRVVAGIDAASPGYKKIIIRPHPGRGVNWVKASYECPYGKIALNWKIEGDKVNMQVEIPQGTTATICIPGKNSMEVGAGSYVFQGINNNPKSIQ